MNLALRSAIAATGNKETVSRRGHLIDDVPELPLIVVDDIEQLQKTKEVENIFLQLGVWADVYRAKESRKVRAGKGKMRGRRYRQAIGPLLVVSRDGSICKAARNLPGVDAVQIEHLNAEVLAPGTHPGRLTIWSKSAFEHLNERFNGGN
jgi:large subunit ribosomal protein L4e